MKTMIFTVILFIASVFSGCNNNTVSEQNTSWKAYCVAYNVDANAPTEEEENYFLDCWCGSVEEEEALN